MQKVVEGYIYDDGTMVFVEPEFTDEQKEVIRKAQNTVNYIHQKYQTTDPIVMMDRNILQEEIFRYLAARKLLRIIGMEE